MAIKKITKGMELQKGMLICVSRGLTVSGPMPIIKITPSQLTVDQESGARNVRLSGLEGYIVDTTEEGDKLFDFLYDRERAIAKAELQAKDEAHKRVMQEWAPAFKVLLGNDKS